MPRGRIAKPWYRAQNQTWYVTLNGQQTPLGTDERKAWAEYNRLMVAHGKGENAGSITVRQLADLWLEECVRTLSAETVVTYRRHAAWFCGICGNMPVKNLKTNHVHPRAYQGVAKSTAHLRITVIRRMIRYGWEMEYFAEEPLRRLKRPGIGRRAPITLEQAEAVMGAVQPHIRTALELLLLLGVRPGELCSLTAARIDLAGRKLRVKGKTGERTVPIPDAAAGILEPLLAGRPTGKLLWSATVPLRPMLLSNAVGYARDKLGEEYAHVTPHCFRGLFSTLALRAGVDSLTVSKLMGHRDPKMLAKHYEGLDDQDLREAMERAARTYGSRLHTPPGLPR